MKAFYSWFVVSAFFLCFFTPAKAAAQDRQDNPSLASLAITGFNPVPFQIRTPRSSWWSSLEGHDVFAARPGAMTPMESGWIEGVALGFKSTPDAKREDLRWWNSGQGGNQHGRPRSGACFYKNVNFTGDYFCSERGSNIPQVKLDDEITSVQIFGRATVTIYKDPNFSGPQATTDQSIPDLHRWRMPNNPNLNWDNRISSARID